MASLPPSPTAQLAEPRVHSLVRLRLSLILPGKPVTNAIISIRHRQESQSRRCLSHGVFRNKEDNAYEFERTLRETFYYQVETWVVGRGIDFYLSGRTVDRRLVRSQFGM